eukprot:13244666-Ditylum_brightwellii.AAC.1
MLESTSGGGANGLAGLAELPQVYLMQTGHNFLCPFNPGDAPTYQARQTPAQREQARLRWEHNRKDFDPCQRMDLLLKNALEKAFDPIWLAEIHTEEHGFGNRLFLDAIIHLYQ